MNALPVIKSIGPPPERHAERMAIEFARWLCAEEQRRFPAWRDAIQNRNDGNPKAQKKMMQKLAALGGNTLLEAHLMPGNRRKYRLALVRLVGWNKGDRIDMDKPVPPEPWLALLLESIVCTYAKIDVKEIALGLISQHAIARLAERCGARDPHDLTFIARDMSMAILKLSKTADRTQMPEGGWRVPFEGGIAVLRLDEDTGIPLIATVLPPEENVRTRTEMA